MSKFLLNCIKWKYKELLTLQYSNIQLYGRAGKNTEKGKGMQKLKPAQGNGIHKLFLP